MDEVDRSLRDLIDSLDLHPRYSLRRTGSRRRRLLESLDLSNPSSIMVPPTTTSPLTGTTTTTTASPMQCSQLYGITVKFCGNVPDGTPNKAKLESYTVQRWLQDTATHIAAKGITNSALMIREAKLAVDPDVGDACRMLNTGRMCDLDSFDIFREKCLKLWRPPEEKDRFLALMQFLSVKRQDTLGTFISDIEKGRQDILADLKADSNFFQGTAQEWVNAQRTDILVSLDEVLNYISWGIIYQDSSPLWRKAFRKIKPQFSDDYLDLMASMQSEVSKLEKSPQVELSAFEDDNPSGQRPFRSDRHSQDRRNNWPGGARPKTNRNQNAPQRNSSQGSGSSQNFHKYVCHSCGRQGHIAPFCRFRGNNSQQMSWDQSSSFQRGQNSHNTQNSQSNQNGRNSQNRVPNSNKNRGAFQTTSDPSSSSKPHRD